jgi:hypothetical protein
MCMLTDWLRPGMEEVCLRTRAVLCGHSLTLVGDIVKQGTSETIETVRVASCDIVPYKSVKQPAKGLEAILCHPRLTWRRACELGSMLGAPTPMQ